MPTLAANQFQTMPHAMLAAGSVSSSVEATSWANARRKHWYGAAPTTAMTHIAIQEKLDGKPVDWLEHVTLQRAQG